MDKASYRVACPQLKKEVEVEEKEENDDGDNDNIVNSNGVPIWGKYEHGSRAKIIYGVEI